MGLWAPELNADAVLPPKISIIDKAKPLKRQSILAGKHLDEAVPGGLPCVS